MGSQTPDRTKITSVWRTAVRTFGILAMAAALFPSGVYRGGAVQTEAEREFVARNPDTLPYRADYTLGWQSSPLVRRYSEATLTTDEVAGVTFNRSNGMRVDLISWSMAALVVGTLLLWASRIRRSVLNRASP